MIHNKNIVYLPIFIFIIIIVIITIKYFKEKYNKKEESFDDKGGERYNYASSNTPNFIQDFTNSTTESSPNYRLQNETQYNYDRLMIKVKSINNETLTLQGKTDYNFYTQSTTDDKLRMDLDMITKNLMKYINDDYFTFAKTNFGDVEVHVDKYGNEEIKYELFLWDIKNYFQIKLWVHVIKFIEKNEIEKYGIRDKMYIFQYFNIGYPFKDQIIPLPDDVITTAHFDLSLSSIRPNEPAPIKHLYLNKIEVQNSTLIVDYHKDKFPENRFEVSDKPDQFSGVSDMSLEYVNIKGGFHDPYLEKGREYNKWPRLDEEPTWKTQYPSKAPPKHWDMDGLYYYGDGDGKPLNKGDCPEYSPGMRWSPNREPLQPYYWPTLATIPRNCGENFWLFDNAQSVNGNTFIGGGKR
jgi:hypothetical protein